MSSNAARPCSVADAAADLIAGRENMRDLKARSETMSYFYLTNIQDCAVLAKFLQGRPHSAHSTSCLAGPMSALP